MKQSEVEWENAKYKESLKEMSRTELEKEWEKQRRNLLPNAAGDVRMIKKKILPQFFADVVSGRKNFELRKDEDDIMAGDVLMLREWDHERYTGREYARHVKYVLRSYPGLEDGYCIIGW